VDGLFEKSGFLKDNIYTPQGDFRFLQCPTPCHQSVYESKPIIDRLRPLIDKKSQTIPKSEIPSCPKCQEYLTGNVRGGDYFIHEHFAPLQRRFIDWVKASFNKKLLVIEIGCGFNTPVVTRFPAESIVRSHPNARLLRINFDQAEVPKDLPRAFGLAGASIPILRLLRLVVNSISREDCESFEKDLIERRRQVGLRQQKEYWENFKDHYGHFDWEIFMSNLL